MQLKKINNIGLRCKLHSIKMQLREARRKNKNNINEIEKEYYSLKRDAKIA